MGPWTTALRPGWARARCSWRPQRFRRPRPPLPPLPLDGSPVTWPRTVDQEPINVGDADYDPLYPYGFGLRTAKGHGRW